MTYTTWNDKFEQEHWTAKEIAESKAKVAIIGAIINAERNGEISHNEAMIRHLMLDPDLAENMLDDAYGNAEETRNVKRRITEARRRTQEEALANI